MTEGNIPGTDRKKSYCIYCPDMLKKLTKENEKGRVENKIKRLHLVTTLQYLHFAIASFDYVFTLQWICSF